MRRSERERESFCTRVRCACSRWYALAMAETKRLGETKPIAHERSSHVRCLREVGIKRSRANGRVVIEVVGFWFAAQLVARWAQDAWAARSLVMCRGGGERSLEARRHVQLGRTLKNVSQFQELLETGG